MKTFKTGITYCFIVGLFLVAMTDRSQSVKKVQVDIKARNTHLKELLEVRSVAQQKSLKKIKTSKKDVGDFIHQIVLSKLPKDSRHEARSLTDSIIIEANKHKMDPLFVISVIQLESQFDPKAVGTVGEIGLMQVRPTTAQWIAEKYDIPMNKKHTLFDVRLNVRIGVAYLAMLREKYEASPRQYLTAYNVGPTKLKSLEKTNKKLKYTYFSKVLENYRDFNSQLL